MYMRSYDVEEFAESLNEILHGLGESIRGYCDEFGNLGFVTVRKSLFEKIKMLFVRGYVVVIYRRSPLAKRHKGRFTSGFL